jgi:hypothetical protein
MAQTPSSRVGLEVASYARALGLAPILARTQRSCLHVRCECSECGAHTYSLPENVQVDRCGNCLTRSLSPIEEITADGALAVPGRERIVAKRRGVRSYEPAA